MCAKRFFSSLVLLLVTTTSLQAQTIPGRWEKVDALAPGTPIIVKLRAGDRFEGAFKNTDPEGISLTDRRQKELRVPKSAVRTVETAAKVRDRLRNGAWIGAGLGSLSGMVAVIGFARSVTASGSIWGQEMTGYMVGAGLVGAGIGALAGTAVDAAMKSGEVIYRAN